MPHSLQPQYRYNEDVCQYYTKVYVRVNVVCRNAGGIAGHGNKHGDWVQ